MPQRFTSQVGKCIGTRTPFRIHNHTATSLPVCRQGFQWRRAAPLPTLMQCAPSEMLSASPGKLSTVSGCKLCTHANLLTLLRGRLPRRCHTHCTPWHVSPQIAAAFDVVARQVAVATVCDRQAPTLSFATRARAVRCRYRRRFGLVSRCCCLATLSAAPAAFSCCWPPCVAAGAVGWRGVGVWCMQAWRGR